MDIKKYITKKNLIICISILIIIISITVLIILKNNTIIFKSKEDVQQDLLNIQNDLEKTEEEDTKDKTINNVYSDYVGVSNRNSLHKTGCK